MGLDDPEVPREHQQDKERNRQTDPPRQRPHQTARIIAARQVPQRRGKTRNDGGECANDDEWNQGLHLAMIAPRPSLVRPAAPAWLVTLLAAALAIAFLALGRWQWRRGEASAAQREAFARGADAVQVLGSAKLAEVARFTRLSVSGRYRPDRQFLLDNHTHGGSAGYEVLTPLELADGRTVLVDRGWVAFTGSRARLPDIGFTPPPLVTVVGRVSEVPSAGLAFGRSAPALTGTWPRLTSYPRIPELDAALGRTLEQRILLLDPAQPYGYLREWQPPGLPPERHWAYAIQWWLFAAVLAAIWATMTARRARQKP